MFILKQFVIVKCQKLIKSISKGEWVIKCMWHVSTWIDFKNVRWNEKQNQVANDSTQWYHLWKFKICNVLIVTTYIWYKMQKHQWIEYTRFWWWWPLDGSGISRVMETNYIHNNFISFLKIRLKLIWHRVNIFHPG